MKVQPLDVKPQTTVATDDAATTTSNCNNLHPSHFSEVQLLQQQFLSMVKRMKLYKSFIPAHLLSEIDEQQDLNTQSPNQQPYKVSGVNGDSNSSSMSHSQSSVESSSKRSSSMNEPKSMHQNSSKKKYSKDVNKFALYLESKKVTLIHVLLEGLNDLLHSLAPQETVSLLSDVFEQVNSMCRSHGAVQIALENDSLTISLNATHKQQNHEVKGAQLCRSLNEKLLSLKFMRWKSNEALKKRPHLIDVLNFRFAMLSHECYCGNLGTSEVKQFTLLSSGKQNLLKMISVAKEMNIAIVCSESVRNSCLKFFQTRYIDTRSFTDDTFVSSFNEGEVPQQDTHIYEIGVSLEKQDDEWMYELADQQQKNKWNSYNQACQLFFEKDYHRAVELFQEYYQSNTNDKPTENMIHKCQTLM
ncbi:hypothetical protein C9374_014021 [Naegleria lovaniensis]|uniref:Uncharacterized protein n=1 Tax=Naegleria lovaniensis TaxID=51637 RepID=A0AA88GW12_NAELO|nr:uncharacterized protein C9374_014021 [Naegleria lovaniensis]KAG2389461.1 hypothetical protein C9374_014021 [Naegleria lovaniensis]